MSLKADPVFSRNQPQRNVKVSPQLVGIARAARIVAGHLATAGQGMFIGFESLDIVALPGVNGERNRVKLP
ncbi:hypothetical protein SDC9_194421 [bioreactor metagenome]|uniref:Uncharacterized protein n=1 Tax=bioreactor metagenome TaxID=1076179 RepID=A0A645I7R9_9ZZZZ